MPLPDILNILKKMNVKPPSEELAAETLNYAIDLFNLKVAIAKENLLFTDKVPEIPKLFDPQTIQNRVDSFFESKW